MLRERNFAQWLGWWAEEVTYDAIKLLHAQGKIPGFFTRGADGQGIDFKTGMDFLIGLWNGLSMKLQVKYSGQEKPFRIVTRHLKKYASVRYVLLFTNKLEGDLVKWERKQKKPGLRDASGKTVPEDRFGRNTPDGIHVAHVHMDAEIYELAAREYATIMAHGRYRELRAEYNRYRTCRGGMTRQLPVELWKRLARVEEEMRTIAEAVRAPFRKDQRYYAFVKRVVAQLECFVEAACVTALWYEKEQELRRQAKSGNGTT